jgi:hypothetical protein
VIERDGMLLAESEWVRPQDGERAVEASVRYRTVGDLTVTDGVCSQARDIATVIAEIEAARVSERGETRADDRTSAGVRVASTARWRARARGGRRCWHSARAAARPMAGRLGRAGRGAGS